jgi:hypothetical protein
MVPQKTEEMGMRKHVVGSTLVTGLLTSVSVMSITAPGWADLIAVDPAAYSAVVGTPSEGTDVVVGPMTSPNPVNLVLGALDGTGAGIVAGLSIAPDATILLGDGLTELVNGPTLGTEVTENKVTGRGSALARAGFQYYFAVVGPANVSVPLLIYTTATTTQHTPTGVDSWDLENSVSATLYRAGIGDNVDLGTRKIFNRYCPDPVCDPTNGVTESDTFPIGPTSVSVLSGFVDSISMFAESYITLSTEGSALDAHVLTNLDPYIVIDPSFPLVSDFSLVFSPFIGNSLVTSAPEPGTLPLLGSALLGLGFLRRRHSKQQQVAQQLAWQEE